MVLGLTACGSSEAEQSGGSFTTAPSSSGDPNGTSGGPDEGDSDRGGSDESGSNEESGGETGSVDMAGCPGGDAAWDALLSRTEAAFAQAGVPGGALAVVCDGSLVHAAGFGVTRSDGGSAVTTQTRFQWASMTKMLTGVAAVSVAEDGLVDLHQPVGNVFGGASWSNVTLHQLLTHTAAYPTEFDVVMSDDLMTVVRDNESQLAWAPPGAVWFYSNPGFAVAGAVIEQASGTPFDALVEDRIFTAANMTRATMSVDEVLAGGDYAYGHSEGGPVGPADSYFGTGSYGPMGGAWGVGQHRRPRPLGRGGPGRRCWRGLGRGHDERPLLSDADQRLPDWLRLRHVRRAVLRA